MSTIGSDIWTQRVTKAAMDNRANQLNPCCSAYWASRAQPAKPQVNTLLAVLAAAAVGAAATAGIILGVQKLIQIKKQKEAEAEEEAPAELEKIEIEGPESEAQ